MLLAAERNQVAGVRERNRVEFLIPGEELLAERGQQAGVVGVGQHGVQGLVGAGTPGITASVSAVMADVEGLVPLRRPGLDRLLEAVGTFHAGGFPPVGEDLVKDLVILGKGSEGEDKGCETNEDAFHIKI